MIHLLMMIMQAEVDDDRLLLFHLVISIISDCNHYYIYYMKSFNVDLVKVIIRIAVHRFFI